MRKAGLEAAFRATTYRVATPEGLFDLRIGVADAAFDAFLLHLTSADEPGNATGMCWGIVTAYNPYGGVQGAHDEHDNRLAQDRLRERITASGWRFLAASNVADDGVWPVEPSYLVLRADEEQMRALGSEFGQLAVVCGRTGSASTLLWLC